MQVGLRIDVDTYRGTRFGVPNLCRLLAETGTRGTFYFSVGPDNMGRHLWRMLRPTFFWKMLRSNAPGLYGWDILLRGTFWPGPVISRGLAPVIAAAAEAGHELGFHAWDHHAWQARIDAMSAATMRAAIARGVAMLTAIAGTPPVTSAAPGWKCNDQALTAKATFPFQYNSDCRGTEIFLPVVVGQPLTQPQVPVTLPTYDEAVGRDGVTDANYNQSILARLVPDRLNVLTVHAEVEGLAKYDLFADFVARLAAKGGTLVPLGRLLPVGDLAVHARMVPGHVPGRQGWVAVQEAAGYGIACRTGRGC